jgi:hypothetical protein
MHFLARRQAQETTAGILRPDKSGLRMTVGCGAEFGIKRRSASFDTPSPRSMTTVTRKENSPNGLAPPSNTHSGHHPER